MKRLFYIILVVPFLIISCGKKSSLVLDKEEMASLMADIHIAEAVVDLDPRTYGADSTKLLLKQSIYEAHGVTAEQVDSSYAWYGHHIEDYMKVYDRTIEILNERQKELLSEATRQVALEGDSVNIWPFDSRFEFSRRSASRLITFAIPADSNWHNNDIFELRFKMVSAKNAPIARMIVEYADGSSIYNIVAGKNNGFDELCVRVDSTRNPLRISGYIITKPREDEVVRLDSISLVRMRSDLGNRFFTLRTFNYGAERKIKAQKDSTATDSAASNKVTVLDTSKGTSHPYPGSSGNSYHPHNSNATAQPKNRATTHVSTTTNNAQRPAQTAPTAGNSSAAQEGVRKRNEILRSASKKK